MNYSSRTLETKLDGSIGEVLGSFSYNIIDGRYGYMKANEDAMRHFLSEKRIKPYLIGYRLYKDGRKIRDFVF